MTPVNQTSIFAFADYRAFLAAYQVERELSLGTLGRKLGMSKMAAKYLVDKARHLADEKIPEVAAALALTPAEAAYFQHLVRFNKAKTTAHRNEHFAALLKAKESPLAELVMRTPEMGFFRDWYYPAIAEMSWLKGFAAKVDWVKPRLAFPVAQSRVEEALRFLGKHGYLAGGKHTASKRKIPDEFLSHQYRTYYAALLTKAGEALEAQPKNEREYAQLTISLTEEKFALAKTMIREFRQRLHDTLADEGADADRVIQVTLQMFTLARTER